MVQSFHRLQQWLHQQDPRVLGVVAAGVVLVALAVWLIIRARRPSPEEVERRRRIAIAANGRLTDGHLTDARNLDGEDSLSSTPEVLFYSYRLHGVTYNCAQDVSSLPDRVSGYSLDQPVHIKYDPRNPGNSILVSEDWSGLGYSQANPQSGTPPSS